VLFAIHASADKRTLEVDIFDRIGESFLGEAVSAKGVRKALKGVKADDTISVRINSRGGDVMDGFAIYNQLKAHRGRVVAHIEGVAASMASVIAMAADEVVMPNRAFMMLHNPFAHAQGDANTLLNAGAALKTMEQELVAAYADKTGLPADQISAMMAKETWLSAAQAKKLGFADSLAAVHAKAEVRFLAEASLDWESAPDEVRNSVCASMKPAAVATVDQEPQESNEKMTPEEFKALLEAAMAPVAERLTALEAKPAPKAEEGPTAEQRKFALERNTKLEHFVSTGKLPNSPEARAFFESQASSAEALAEVCAHYEASAPVVKTTKTVIDPPKAEVDSGLSKQQLKFMKEQGWSAEALYGDAAK